MFYNHMYMSGFGAVYTSLLALCTNKNRVYDLHLVLVAPGRVDSRGWTWQL